MRGGDHRGELVLIPKGGVGREGEGEGVDEGGKRVRVRVGIGL